MFQRDFKIKEFRLLTNQKAPITIDENGIMFYDNYCNDGKEPLFNNQHLYITNAKPIEAEFKGWVIVTLGKNNYLVQVDKTERDQCYTKLGTKFSFGFYTVREIISTTNKDLLLPLIEKEYVIKHIDRYNKRNYVKSVLKEYEDYLPLEKMLELMNT